MPPFSESELWASIAAQVRAVRKAAGLSQAEIAARIGTSISAISRLESARGRPTVRTLFRLARETGAVFTVGSPSAPVISDPAPAPVTPPAEDGTENP